MSVTMTNHLVIWNRTCLEGISRESLKTDFMSRHNVFQFWFIIIYLRLTHTILWLEIIPYNINEQFDTFGDGINFLSWIWGHKSIMSRRNAFWIMPDFLCLGRFREVTSQEGVSLRGGLDIGIILFSHCIFCGKECGRKAWKMSGLEYHFIAGILIDGKF